MTATDAPAPPRCGPGPGRPRSAACDEAILVAAIDLFAELGFEGISFEAVAERAGVAKSTIYRRYPTKVDLVMGAWRFASPPPEQPAGTGSLLDDLTTFAVRMRWVLAESPVGRAVPAALAASARVPEFADAHRAFIDGRREPMVAMIERCSATGELRADTDPQLLLDLVIGTVFYRALTASPALADDDVAVLVAQVVSSFRPGA